jgi:TPR repeat protein/tRNA A-37 threonylcarbamoyl transferase component Bud32
MLQPGTLFAQDFRIVRPLGEGGMGAVFVAEQLSTGAQRALKIIRPELVNDPRLRERFEQEARVSARIQSDHVVQVVGAGIDPSTRIPWLAMELLTGQTLADALQARGRLGAAEVIEIVSQLCHALGAAHAVGIVHRDLKPENIYLADARRTGVPFFVKVLDFGIARVLAEARKTATGPLGTPLWMAPEQTGAGEIGPWTDVWALGLIVFWALTGREYWLAAASEETSMSVMREILVDPLVPASHRAAQLGVRDPLPAGFDAWFGQCVARDPRQRFMAVIAAREALNAVLGQPAPPPTISSAPTELPSPPKLVSPPTERFTPAAAPGVPPAPVRAPTRRPMLGIGIAAGVVAACVLGAIGWRSYGRKHDAQTCRASDKAAEVRIAACQSECDRAKGGEACLVLGNLLASGTHEQLSRAMTVLGSACDAGNSAACRRLGLLEAFPPRSGVEPERKKAADHFKRACDGGDVHCGPLALAQELGWAATRAEAFATYGRACRAGDAFGCVGRAAAINGFRAPPGTNVDALQVPPSLRARCDQADGEACALLGWFEESAKHAGVRALDQKACDLGDPMGCNNLGVAYVAAIDGPAKPADALALFDRACAAGDPVGCNNVGALRSGLRYVVRDGARGDRVFKLRCHRAFGIGCAGWGEGIDVWPNGPKDLHGAAVSFQKACEMGLSTACVNLGALVFLGQGTTKDHKRAQELFATACDDGEAGACGENASIYLLETREVPRDPSKAFPLMKMACDAGELDACANVHQMVSEGIGVRADPEGGARGLRELCERRKVGCKSLADAYLDGVGVTKDEKKGRELLAAVCDDGRGQGCDEYGMLWSLGAGGDKDPSRANDIWRAACDNDDLESCVRLAYRYADGRFVQKDLARAAQLLDKGCSMGSARACNGLGQAYLNGDGVARDEKRGAALVRASCDDGYMPGCGAYGILVASGVGEDKNVEKATSYLQAGCRVELHKKPEFQLTCNKLRELGKPLPPKPDG